MKTRGGLITMSPEELLTLIETRRREGWNACISEFCDHATRMTQGRSGSFARVEREAFWQLIAHVEDSDGFERTFDYHRESSDRGDRS